MLSEVIVYRAALLDHMTLFMVFLLDSHYKFTTENGEEKGLDTLLSNVAQKAHS